jgi:hypothetical protein
VELDVDGRIVFNWFREKTEFEGATGFNWFSVMLTGEVL